jgi:hypothetical protein
MGNVNTDGIWTPDESDNLDPEVWSAAMGDSISQGIGLRLANQELDLGVSLNVAEGNHAPVAMDVTTTVPFTVCPGGFATGMTVAGGVVTIEQDGLYFLSTGVSFDVAVDSVFTIQISSQSRTLVRGHGQSVVFTDGSFGFLPLCTMARLTAGDTVRTTIYSHTAAGTIRAYIQASNTFSIALLYAT